MEIAYVGSAGIGAVWGWLVARLDKGSQRLWSKLVLIGSVTLLLCAQVVLTAGISGLFYFLGAACVALLFHLAWRSTLRKRNVPSQTQNGGLK